MEPILVDCVQKSLRHFMHVNAIFLCQRLCAEFPTEFGRRKLEWGAGRGPVLGPMVYGCLNCAQSYLKTLSTLSFADSKTLKEEKREEMFPTYM